MSFPPLFGYSATRSHSTPPIAHPLLRITATTQTIGQEDGYQRVYPDRASAEAAFNRFENEGIYPDYGKAPWVVFLGRNVGVLTKMYVVSSFVTTVHNLTTLEH